jgi:hypothetical protein
MPYDLHMLPGKRRFVPGDVDLIDYVRAKFPGAMTEGACGTRSFTIDGELVAECWLHPTRNGWWVRLKEK